MSALSVANEPIPPAPPAPPGAPVTTGAQKGQGVCAVVLYDYEAAEENEIPLTEGELIEQIEQIDEGTHILLYHLLVVTICFRMVVWCRSWWKERPVSRLVSSYKRRAFRSLTYRFYVANYVEVVEKSEQTPETEEASIPPPPPPVSFYYSN